MTQPNMSDQERRSRAWYITQRWCSYEGEIRAAVLRVTLVVVFYALHLLDFLLYSEPTPEESIFHRYVTWLAAGWLCVSLAVLVSLRQRFFPRCVKFATVAFDLALLTAAAIIGSGPASPIVSGYFVILATSGLRFSLPAVWLATAGAILGYMLLVASVDPQWFDAEHTTPVVEQSMMVVSLAATGIILGQVIRMVRESAEAYSDRNKHLEQIGVAEQATVVMTAETTESG